MYSVVVLNRNYQFWTEVSVKKALKWFLTDKIEIVEAHDSMEIGSITFKIKAPLVVRLLNFVGFKPKRGAIPYSSEAIYERDNNICQYWHKDDKGKKFKYKCSVDDRTIDHINPISRGGKSSFLNCACCCRTCNELVKKNRLPKEVGLELLRKPYAPKRDTHSFVIKRFAYNERKVAHKIYHEKILGKKFSHVLA